MSDVETLKVELGARSYDIVIGPNLLAEAGTRIAPFVTRRRVFLVTDENVAGLHLEELRGALEQADIECHCRILPAGEATKAFRTIEQLSDWLLGEGIERKDLLVAFGGGVIGDLVGFLAAITLRGIDFIQIPTTLLAQVDSSVGGKTGINCRWGKNLIGAFHQPRLVLADTTVLETLPQRELLAGYAEVVKYGLIDDPDFFAWLEGHGLSLLDGDSAARIHAVRTSCAAKAAIVAEDEREAGKRALLNLGHTFGHALEAEAGYSGALLHGEAVAVGMVMAYDLSVSLGLCAREDAARVMRHLASVGLSTSPQALMIQGLAWSPQRLLEHMGRDKKVEAGRMVFILARGIGQAFRCDDVAPQSVAALLTATIAA